MKGHFWLTVVNKALCIFNTAFKDIYERSLEDNDFKDRRLMICSWYERMLMGRLFCSKMRGFSTLKPSVRSVRCRNNIPRMMIWEFKLKQGSSMISGLWNLSDAFTLSFYFVSHKKPNE